MRRRDFLRGTAFAAGLAALHGCAKKPDRAPTSSSPPAPTASPTAEALSGRATVVTVRSERAVANGVPDAGAAAAMLDAGMRELTGAGSAAEAFARLFGPDDVVAIKVNCIGRLTLSTSPIVCGAVVAALIKAGVQPSAITVFDRNSGELSAAGYDIVRSGGFLCYGTDGKYGREVSAGSYRGRLSAILEQCTAIINMPVLKDHGITGVSIALKNHYGSIDNPRKYHRGQGVPGIAEVNSLPAIAQKTRLIVADATRACFTGGPTPPETAVVEEKALLVATDPVALDAVGYELIRTRRRSLNLGDVARPPWLDVAERLGVGVASAARIEGREVSV